MTQFDAVEGTLIIKNINQSKNTTTPNAQPLIGQTHEKITAENTKHTKHKTTIFYNMIATKKIKIKK